MSSADTVGSLLASIATSLQDALRILMFADKRGWGPDEFEQVRAVEDALDEAKRDFQAMAPLVNGQFYYENDRRPESLEELRALRTKFSSHTQNFKDWVRIGGHINAAWVRETVSLRRQLHRAQCRAARRIFNAEREDGASGGRCLGAFLVYRRWRDLEDRRSRETAAQAQVPTWKAQQAQMHAREDRKYLGREHLTRRGSPEYTESVEMTSQLPLQDVPLSPYSSHQSNQTSAQHTPTTPSSNAPMVARSGPSRPATLEDLVPDCNAIGSFERFGDQDIVFICDYCDGHIVWEDLQRLPASRTPPAAISSSSAAPAASSSSAPAATSNGHSLPSRPTLSLVTSNYSAPGFNPPGPRGTAPSAPSQPQSRNSDGTDAYPHWQATAMTMSRRDQTHTIVFAPLAIANHLPPMGSSWEARLWCPYCDDYLYFDQGEGDQTKYAQDEHGFLTLSEFQEHLEWYHTAMSVPVPASTKGCTMM